MNNLFSALKLKKNSRKDIYYLSVVLIVIILINYIANFLFFRIDLTSEKRYTLNPQTKKMLSNLQDRVFIRIYLDGDDLPYGFKRLRDATKETLDEFKVFAGKHIEYEFVNPSENSDAKVRKAIYSQLMEKGIQPIELKQKQKSGKQSESIVFPAAMLVYKDFEIPIKLLKNTKTETADVNLNNSIQSLEYELSNAIRKLIINKIQKIAFITGHNELTKLETDGITSILSEYYTVDRGKIGGQIGILDSFSAIIIAKPLQKLDEKDKFVIDQYIMNGGKVLWFLDGTNAEMDSIATNNQMIVMDLSVNLEDQLFKYGVRINPNLISDLQCGQIGLSAGNQQGIKLFPWYYFPLIISQNNHQITKYLNIAHTEFVSSLDTVGEMPLVKKTILLQTSPFTRVETVPFQLNADLLTKQVNEQLFHQRPQNVAVLLEGKFESVFNNRNIKSLFNSQNISMLKESKPTKMLVVSDGDWIKNSVDPNGKPYSLDFDRFSRYSFQGNGEFILNSVNYLCDDAGLMSVRLRELKMRLLDRARIDNERLFWQLINLLIPILFLFIFGISVNYFRKRKYAAI